MQIKHPCAIWVNLFLSSMRNWKMLWKLPYSSTHCRTLTISSPLCVLLPPQCAVEACVTWANKSLTDPPKQCMPGNSRQDLRRVSRLGKHCLVCVIKHSFPLKNIPQDCNSSYKHFSYLFYFLFVIFAWVWKINNVAFIRKLQRKKALCATCSEHQDALMWVLFQRF